MRVALNRVTSDCLKLIYDNVSAKEETLELVVPDVCADIGTVLDVRGALLLNSHKAKSEEIAVCLSVEITVIYAAEDSGKIQTLSATIPFDQTISAPGVSENARTVVRCRLCRCDARMLNPRKLLLRAETAMRVCAYCSDTFTLWDNLCADEACKVHILQKEIEHCLVTGIRERSFVISDEYRLPEEKGQNLKMLSAGTELCVQDAKPVGNKLVIKAEATTTTVFLNEEDGSLFSCVFSTLFSQIVETEAFGENMQDVVTLQLKDTEFTCLPSRENGFCVAVQLNICAFVVSMEKKCSTYIADAYSNNLTLEVETADVKAMKCMDFKTLRFNLKGKLQPRQTLSGICYTALDGVCAEAAGNTLSVKAIVSGAGKNEDGGREAIFVEMTAEESVDLTKGQSLKLISVCPETPVVVGTGQNTEVSVFVDVLYSVNESFEVTAICGIEAEEKCCVKNTQSPSFIMLCSNKEADLWTLAKTYGSTTELIKAANSADGDFSISRRPLLIPKAK